MAERAVLVMAYGTPASLDEVEAYYTHIRRGSPPPPGQLEELKDRYRAIGGKSPLLEVTEAQARGLEERVGVPVYVGLKHSAPFIEDAVRAMANDGVESAVGLVLAPHYSTMSVGDYARRAERAAAEVAWDGKLQMIEAWHLEPGFLAWTARAVRRAIDALPEATRARAVAIFTAHSLPASLVEKGDPYADQLHETAEAVARMLELDRWRVAWQSAGRTAESWLGPDVNEVIDDLALEGASAVVVCPCGFVADHLEVLYDLDIEAGGRAGERGLAFTRTASPNDDPDFLDVLATVVRRA